MGKINLLKNCGLAINLDNYKLIFEETSIPKVEPAIRTLSQARDVLCDKNAVGADELYYMYRDVHKGFDVELMKKYNLRFDITVIRPGMIGNEFVKTVGHYHPKAYPELYEVVYGRALCLLQRPDPKDPRNIIDTFIVEAQTGDKMVMLPYYGHILINPDPVAPLVTSNWVSSQFSSEYQLYQQARGATYYVLNENGKITFKANPYYQNLPSLKIMRPASKIEKFGLEKNRPMYPLINSSPKSLDFLNEPLRFDYSGVFIVK